MEIAWDPDTAQALVQALRYSHCLDIKENSSENICSGEIKLAEGDRKVHQKEGEGMNAGVVIVKCEQSGF